MENTAQGHKSSVGPSRGEDEARNSDSGDSVFFSQKPLPEAVLSGDLRLPRLRSPFTQEGPPEPEDDILSSSSSEDESRTKRKKRRRRRVLKVPSCRFSFLSERKDQTNGLLRVKIKKLHSYTIGGYMKHVKELWECYERGEDVAASLPTVDVEAEELSPVSEDEKDEAIEDEDIKVVERKHFAASIKAKTSQPWCASKARSGRKRNLTPASNGSPGPQQKTPAEVLTSEPALKETPSAATQTSRDEDTPRGETRSRVTSDGKTGERPKEKNRRDERSETLGPEGHTQGDEDPRSRGLHLNERSRLGNAECENGNVSQSDVNDALLKKRRKKKEGRDVCEGVEKEKKQDGTEGQLEEELLSPLEDINMKDVPESKPKKKKKKKAAPEDGRQDDGSVEQASVVSSKTQADWKKQENSMDVDGGRTDPAAEPQTDEANVQKTKDKKQKDPNVTSGLCENSTEHHVENTEAPQETPSSLLREPKFTKRKDKKMKHSAPAGEDVNFSNDNATNTDSTSQMKMDTSDAAEDDEKVVNKQKEEQAPELKTKKKKKKKKAAPEDGRQDDGSVEQASVANSKTQADWKKQENSMDVDGGRTDPAAEPPTDEANVRKTKDKKQKDPNVTSGLCENHVENTEAPQETELSFTKIKHKKKKHPASAGEDVKFCNDAVTNTDSTSQTKTMERSDAAEEDERKEEQAPEIQTKRKKKKAACASHDATKTDSTSQKKKKKMVDMSDAAEEDGEDVNKQKEELAPELKAKKKKQKTNCVARREDTAAQDSYSAVVRKKEKQATSSFLAADEEENGAEERREFSQSAAGTLQLSAADLATNSAENAESSERLKDEIKTKKKKKKRSAVQQSVGGETGFKEPMGRPAVEVKKKRKCERSNSELTSSSALSLEESQTDADVPLKKKKKKDKIPAAGREDDGAEPSTQLSSDSQKKTFKNKVEKAGNKLSLAEKSSVKPAESEACNTKQRGKTEFNLDSKAPPLSLKRKNNKKRKLYHASLDFLSDI